ncbi:MAG: SCO family protein [Candidatus Binataceae bacterium]
MLAFALGVLASGCARGDAPGSYEASNRADCLPDLPMTDQNGRATSLASLKGKPVLIDFIYTTCNSTCPLQTAKMAKVARLLGPRLGSQVMIVSLTLDPETDSVAKLRDYAARYGADARGWLFLTGQPKTVDEALARFRVHRERADDGQVAHVAAAFLLGADGRQIRQYNALVVAPDAVVDDVRAFAHAG